MDGMVWLLCVGVWARMCVCMFYITAILYFFMEAFKYLMASDFY